MLHNSISYFPSHFRIYVFILFNLPVFIYVIIICRQTDKQINKQAKSIKSYDARTHNVTLFVRHSHNCPTHSCPHLFFSIKSIVILLLGSMEDRQASFSLSFVIENKFCCVELALLLTLALFNFTSDSVLIHLCA